MGNLLGVFGNENIRAYHIKYFEDKLIDHKENERKDITLTPHYYAWLSLMTEHIFWILRDFCFKQTDLKEQNLDLCYNELVTKFCDIARSLCVFSEAEINHLYNTLVKIMAVRHAIIHKGFPNPLPAILLRNKPAITKGSAQEKFSELSTKEIMGWYSDPRNFHFIKAEFELIKSAMAKGHGISVGL